jgi:hypothetical protein
VGSDAEIFLFDDAAYRGRVVPALGAFVHTGEQTEWLERILRELKEYVGPTMDLARVRALGFDLGATCHYLGPDFAFTPTVAGARERWCEWEVRACTSPTCAAREICPLHGSRSVDAPEQFTMLIEACVADQCLGQGQFLGRSMNALDYTEMLEAAGLAPNHDLFRYLNLLRYRGFVVGYAFGSTEGIDGWLTAEETPVFLRLLDLLDLPKVAPSFEAMRIVHVEEMARTEHEPHGWERVSLALLRGVASIATAEGRGVLWGNDVGVWWRPRA